MLNHVLSLSGGKDSTALRLLAKERDVPVSVIFADTGNEHPITYEYIDYLESKLGPITKISMDKTLIAKRIEGKRRFIEKHWFNEGVSDEQIKSALDLLHPTGNPFLDLCIWKGRFPSTRRRFCSEILKHEPIRTQIIDPLLVHGYTVVSWQGVRADESTSRANLDIVEQPDESEDLIIYRPLITWTAEDVFNMHRYHGIKWNPLYEYGMKRVGCMPCIHAGKWETRHIASQFPEVIDRIERWEEIVSKCSKRGSSTFLDQRILKIPEPIHYSTHGVRQYVNWANTKWGGKIYDEAVDEIDAEQCTSIYNLCE